MLLLYILLLTLAITVSSVEIDPCEKYHCKCFGETALCAGRAITEVPQNLTSHIQYLTLEHTNIEMLDSTSFSNYPQLSHLYVRYNYRLKKLSSHFIKYNTNLNKIFIRYNPILGEFQHDTFVGDFDSLRLVDLSYNNFDEFPDLSGIFSLGTTLDYDLVLDGNPLTQPRPLCGRSKPKMKGNCQFVEISMKQMKLRHFTSGILNGTYTDILDLSSNSELVKIDEDTFIKLSSKLHTLNLSNNTKLDTLPSTGLNYLRKLKFTDCPLIKQIPPTINFVEIKAVELTYPQHCCAFKKPYIQDKQAYMQALKKYEDKLCRGVEVSSSGITTEPSLIYSRRRRSTDLMNFPIDWSKINLHPEISTLESAPSVYHSTTHPTFLEITINPNIDHNITANVTCDEAEFEQLRDQMTCIPNENAFTPCGNIFEESHWLRIILWIIAICAVTGNIVVLTFTILSSTKTPMTVTKFLICNLAFADAMLGIYLITLASVDLKTLGQYFNYATWWQTEGGCDSIGFITVFASELSVYTLSVITLERWYAISHAIHLTKRMQMKQALVIMTFGWLLSIGLALMPLPLFDYVQFSSYQLTSLCLPFKYDSILDKVYILFLLGFNMAAFILVCCCYISIFRQVRGSNAAMKSDTYLARRMAVLIFTDLICWGPVAVVAGLSAGGVNLQASFLTDSSSLYIAKIILIFFYPFNACANPYLYAIITKQFQKDCILALTHCGLCKKKARRIRHQWHGHSDSQWSTRHQLKQTMSNTTQCTTTTTAHDRRGSLHSCIDTLQCNGVLNRSLSLDGKHQSESHATLKECAMKALNHRNASQHRRKAAKQGNFYLEHSGAGTISCSASTIDSIDSRRPSDVIMRVPETLPEADSISCSGVWDSDFNQQWRQHSWLNSEQSGLKESKVSDHDSGAELNQISESDADELLAGSNNNEYDIDSETESGYRGRITSNSYDELLLKHKNISDTENSIEIVVTDEIDSNYSQHNITNRHEEYCTEEDNELCVPLATYTSQC